MNERCLNHRAEQMIASALRHDYNVAAMFVDPGGFKAVSASIGIAMLPEHGEDLATLRKPADHAMYHTKRSDRGSYQVYNASLAA